jgi:hypothetical protein
LYPAAYAVFEAAAADDGAGPAQDLEALVVEVSFFKCRVQRVTMKANCWMVCTGSKFGGDSTPQILGLCVHRMYGCRFNLSSLAPGIWLTDASCVAYDGGRFTGLRCPPHPSMVQLLMSASPVGRHPA